MILETLITGVLFGLSGTVGVGIILGIFTFFETFIQRGHMIKALRKDNKNVWKKLDEERSKR